MTYPLPKDEEQRLEEIKKLNLLDTLGEESYRLLTEVASEILDMPLVLITVLDESNQWFLAKIGVERQKTPREDVICNYNILDEEPLVVSDLSIDARFKNNPDVIGGPSYRFYAGVPIKSPEGHIIGSFCALDFNSREVTEKDKKALKAFALQVGTLIKMRAISDELKKTRQENKNLRELIPMCSWCNSIRDSNNYWQKVEQYVMDLTGREVSHAVCGGCADDLHDQMTLDGISED